MGIDVWEVVEAAATKPFGFQSFQPGPGLGGHCIPLDPYYLSWKAREYDFSARFIELAGEVNNNMPYFCRSVISQALNHGLRKSVSGSKILISGVAYKADIGDSRETPAEKLIELLRTAGAEVSYHDPHVPEFDGMSSAELVPEDYDCVAIVTAHTSIDYAELVRRSNVVVDFKERDARARERRQGMEALGTDPVRVAQIGLGAWGQNLVRNLDALAELSWICETGDERRATFARRFPNAIATGSYEELLADPDLEAVVIATPVPTHYALAKQALEAGKHVFVEKPPAMRAAEMEELVAISEDRGLVLMPGHLLLYHPGVRKLKELVDTGDLGDVLCIYGNRQNLGTIRKDENALWSLGVHDLSVILHLVGEEPSEAWAQGNAFLNPGVEDVVFCFMRFPSGKIAHLHLSWLDPHKMRKLQWWGATRWRCSTTWSSSAR